MHENQIPMAALDGSAPPASVPEGKRSARLTYRQKKALDEWYGHHASRFASSGLTRRQIAAEAAAQFSINVTESLIKGIEDDRGIVRRAFRPPVMAPGDDDRAEKWGDRLRKAEAETARLRRELADYRKRDGELRSRIEYRLDRLEAQITEYLERATAPGVAG